MNSILLNAHKTLNRLPIEERAKIKGALPPELSIKNIAKLKYTDSQNYQKLLTDALIAECKAGNLAYYGDIDGWTWGGTHGANPYPKITKGKSNSRERAPDEDLLRHILYDDYSTYSDAGECLIHREDFRRYLEAAGEWPIKNCLLMNWWTEKLESDEEDDINSRRLASFKKHKSELDLNASKKAIYAQLRKLDQTPGLWLHISDATLDTDFWPLTRIKKKPGAKPKNKLND